MRKMTKLIKIAQWSMVAVILVCWSYATSTQFVKGVSSPLLYRRQSVSRMVTIRGGSTWQSESENDAYDQLTDFLQQERFPESSSQELLESLFRLATAQQAFKGLDGAAHEAYQRTHSGGSSSIDTSIVGRAKRSAARLAATAQALLACELVEMVEKPELATNLALGNRTVLLNLTSSSEHAIRLGNGKLAVLLLYEKDYHGGAGLDHGSIETLANAPKEVSPKGRLLVVLGETDISNDLAESLSILNETPHRIKLSTGLVSNEMASVQPTLYNTAGKLLETLDPFLRKYNTTAVHFVGRSLAGGVASLASTILDGAIPPPTRKKKGKGLSTTRRDLNEEHIGSSNTTRKYHDPESAPLSEVGRARSSALTLGAPPCLSSNVLAAFCTSILYGDDIICRSSSDSIDRLCKRIQRYLNQGFVGRNLGWMSDTVSLTASSLRSHAHGSEGEEARLAVPGRAFLIRPRRLGGICSIHEVGNLYKGGRDALRANVFWQLHDILLSTSMWKHHQLEAYIHGLDRVQLRGYTEQADLL